MGILKKATTLSYFTLILLLALAFTLSACKKKQSPPARDETQNVLVESTTQPQPQ